MESYQYLGLSSIVQRTRPEPGITLSYVQQAGDPNAVNDAGGQYTGLDRFGRVIDQFWFQTTVGGTTTRDRFQYRYDADSNRLYRDNLVDGRFGELYGHLPSRNAL